MTKTLQVLITRPSGTEKDLCKKISALHCNDVRFNPLIFPAVEIVDVDITANAIQTILKNISKFDGVIFISPIAIQKFHSLKVVLPKFMPIYCIGEDSYLKIKKLLLREAVYPKQQHNAEALMALPEMQHIQNKRFLICQGKGGRDLIQEALKKRGAKLTSLILYERCLPSPKKLPHLDVIDIIVCTSEQSLKNLCQIFGEPIKNKRFLVSSERLSLLGKELGLKWPSIFANGAGDAAIVKALQSYANECK